MLAQGDVLAPRDVLGEEKSDLDSGLACEPPKHLARASAPRQGDHTCIVVQWADGGREWKLLAQDQDRRQVLTEGFGAGTAKA